MSSFNNILLINFGGIGDEILFLPVISSLKEEYPNAKITLCLEQRSSAFLNLTKLIDSYFFINIKVKNKYIELIKLYFKALTGNYDLVISSGGNKLIPLLLFLTGIKTRIAYKTSDLSEVLLTKAVVLNKNQYAARMYFDLIKPICNQEFENPVIETENITKIPDSVLIHPGVSKISIKKNIIKTITPEKWAELIKLLLLKNKKVFLAGGPDDEECISAIKKNLTDCDLSNFTDLYGTTKNICDLVKLINQNEILICSDSAPMHIGVATNTKTIAIFGPTDEKKLLPESDNFIAITNNSNCRPCLWNKRQVTCENLYCLNIKTDEILKFL